MVNISLGYFRILDVDGFTCRRKVDYDIQGATPRCKSVFCTSLKKPSRIPSNEILVMMVFHEHLLIQLHLHVHNLRSINLDQYIWIMWLGEKAMTANVHQLRHLVYFVRLFGPLWVYSCFGFENMNGCLTSMIHGTRHIAEQVLWVN